MEEAMCRGGVRLEGQVTGEYPRVMPLPND